MAFFFSSSVVPLELAAYLTVLGASLEEIIFNLFAVKAQEHAGIACEPQVQLWFID